MLLTFKLHVSAFWYLLLFVKGKVFFVFSRKKPLINPMLRDVVRASSY